MSIIIARVGTDQFKREVCCHRKPTPQQINLLYVLSEHVGRIISIDDICHRMKMKVSTVRFHACRLRQKLDDKWTVDAVTNRGYRLVYIGDELSEAESTRLELEPGVLVPYSIAMREQIRASAAFRRSLRTANQT